MRKLALKVSVVATALMPSIAFAQRGDIPESGLGSPIDEPQDVVTVLDTVAQWLFTIFFALAIVFLVYAAFLYLTAAGNESRIASAKNVLIFSIVAIVVALIAAGIPTVVEGLLDVGS